MKLWKFRNETRILLAIRWLSFLFMIFFVVMAIHSIVFVNTETIYAQKLDLMLGL